jgi:hypothetical protein
MTARAWKVRVIGVVSMPEGNRRVPVATGDYKMTEAAGESYHLTRDGAPTFDLTVTEVETYRKDNKLKIEGEWP